MSSGSTVPRLIARGAWDTLRHHPISAADIDRCAEARVSGLAAHGLAFHGVPLEPATTERLLFHAAKAAVGSTTLDSRCAAAVEELTTHGIATLVLKGVAVARLDYDQPEHREYGDVDLLIRGADIGAAVDLLARHGFERQFEEPFRGHDESFGKGIALSTRGSIGIDLHRTLALGYYGTRLPIDELWSETVPLNVAGVEAEALCRRARFIHSALHGALTPARTLLDSLDLVTIARNLPDVEGVIDSAEEWGCAGPVAASITVAEWELAGLLPQPLVEWAAARRRLVREWLVDTAYSGPLAGSRQRTLTALAGVRGWNRRLELARQLGSSMRRERPT